MGWFEKREFARTGEVERCWKISVEIYVDRKVEGNIRGADE